MDTVNLRVFSFSQKANEAWIETNMTDRVELKVYTRAKTIADCLYYQKMVGLDVWIEELRGAWRSRKVTTDELIHFSEVRTLK